jgi:glycine cleavage system aminomethyltransferase T
MEVRVKIVTESESGWNYNLWRSSFFPVTERLGAAYGTMNGRMCPVYLGGASRNSGRDYMVMRNAAAMYDVSLERSIDFVGPDAEAMLDCLFTRSIAKIRPGKSGYSIICYEHGGLLCDGVLLRLEQDHFRFAHASGEMFPYFVAHARGRNVKVSDPDVSVLQIAGPASLQVLANASSNGLPDPFPRWAVARLSIGGQDVIVSRTGYTGEDKGFEVYITREQDGPKLWDDLTRAGISNGMIASGLDSMDIRRIEGGNLNYGTDIDERLNPFQCGLGHLVDFSKTEFEGRTALQGADRNLLIYGVKCVSGEPDIGARIVDDSYGDIGVITAAASSPYLKAGVGIVRLHRFVPIESTSIRVKTRSGEHAAAELLKLPFYR